MFGAAHTQHRGPVAIWSAPGVGDRHYPPVREPQVKAAFMGAQAQATELSSVATFYSTPPCDNQGTLTASGQPVHWGVIASDWLPLYTRIELAEPLAGKRIFTVLDTGAHFDVWIPCSGFGLALQRHWSNPTLRFRVLRWGRPVAHSD